MAKVDIIVGAQDQASPALRGISGQLGSLRQHARMAGMAMVAMGTAIVAGMGLAVKSWAAAGDEVQKMALRTGFTTEALSELRHAADLSGTSLMGIEKASRNLVKVVTQAGDGLETYTRALARVGLSYEELKDLSPEDLFFTVLEATAGVTDEQVKLTAAQELFGARMGTSLLPLMADGAEGLRRMMEEAEGLGLVFDQLSAENAAALQDAFTRIKAAIQGVQNLIGAALAPTLTDLAEKIAKVVSAISAWAKMHPGLSKALTITLGVVGLLSIALGTAVLMYMTKFLPALTAVTAAIWAKVAALWAAMVALGPVGWAMAATAAALLTTGLILLNRHHKQSIEGVTASTDKSTAAIRRETAAIDEETEALERETEARIAASNAAAEWQEAVSWAKRGQLEAWIGAQIEREERATESIQAEQTAPVIVLDGERVGSLIMNRAGESYLQEAHMR